MAGSYRFDAFELDGEARQLTGPEGPVPLRGQALHLLALLVWRAPAVVHRDEILEHVWGHGERSDSAIPQTIREIRAALGDTAKEPRFVATRYGKGYQFLVDVERIDRSGATSDRRPRRAQALMLLALALVVALFAFERFQGQQRPTPSEPSIAVLPFANLSGDESQDYFSIGMSDELIGLLGRVPELRVIGRKSSFQFDDESRDLRQIGRELGVTHVVDGSVRRSGEIVRITAELLSAADGTQLWSRTFDRRIGDMLRVQNEIGRSVVATLRVELLGDDLPQPAALPVADAYDQYLRGLRLRRLAGPAALREAEAHFKKAIALDPTLAVAWDGLSATYTNQVSVGIRSREEGITLARDAVERTLVLNPQLAAPYYGLGFVQMVFDRDWTRAEESFRQCLALEPNHAGALSGLGLLQAARGRHAEARALIQRSVERDPLNVTGHHNRGFIAYLGSDYETAEAAFRRALSLVNGAYARGNSRLSMVLLASGRAEEALTMAAEDPGQMWRLASEAMALHALGRGGETEVDRLESEFPDRAATSIARVHAFRGASDKAFDWLDRADRLRDPELTWVLTDPLFEVLRDDSRWEALITRLGLRS